MTKLRVYAKCVLVTDVEVDGDEWSELEAAAREIGDQAIMDGSVKDWDLTAECDVVTINEVAAR